MKRLLLLSLICCSVGHAQSGRDVFLASLDKFAREHEQMRLDDVYLMARTAFGQSPDEIKKSVADWLAGLPTFSNRAGYTLVTEYGKPVTQEQADTALMERPSSARLFMQGVAPSDIVSLAISQAESLGFLKVRQSYQIGRVYLRPEVELISRSAGVVRLAIYDFDSLIELTTVQAGAGVLCPTVFRVFRKLPAGEMPPAASVGKSVQPAHGFMHM